MYENVGELGATYLRNKRSEELAKVETEIFKLEQKLEWRRKRETADLAVLEYWWAKATQIRDKESIEKKGLEYKNIELGGGMGFSGKGSFSGYTISGVTSKACSIDGVKYQKMGEHPMGRVLIKAFELCLKKNRDYATQEDIFANFRESTDMGVLCSAGVGTRLGDKWKRFKKGVRTGWKMEVKDEGMEQTVLDIINYSAIYYCLYIEECRDKMTEDTPSPKQKPGAY